MNVYDVSLCNIDQAWWKMARPSFDLYMYDDIV
jgi:hypothetical protein